MLLEVAELLDDPGLTDRRLTMALHALVRHHTFRVCEAPGCGGLYCMPKDSALCAAEAEGADVRTLYCLPCRPAVLFAFAALPRRACSSRRCGAVLEWTGGCSHMTCPCTASEGRLDFRTRGHTCYLCGGVFTGFVAFEDPTCLRACPPPFRPFCVPSSAVHALDAAHAAMNGEDDDDRPSDYLQAWRPTEADEPDDNLYCACVARRYAGSRCTVFEDYVSLSRATRSEPVPAPALWALGISPEEVRSAAPP
jgi:hypothetical protein